MKQSKLAILAILVTIVAMAAPASAVIGSQNIETKSERMVDIAYRAQETIMGVVDQVEGDATAYQMLLDANLDEIFYDNVLRCVEYNTLVNGENADADGDGWVFLAAAVQDYEDKEYEDAIENARDALEIFREVLRAINDILDDAGVETETILEAELLQEAIDRAKDRITQLRALLDDEHELETTLNGADLLLNDAQEAVNEDNLEEAKDALMEANSIISDVCAELREIAKELNPGRIQSYLVHARQYRERFREMFGHAWEQGISVDEVAIGLNYEGEQDFMDKLQRMIDEAQDANDINEAIKELKDFSKMAKRMDEALTQEFGNRGNRNGQGNNNPGSGKGNGNMGGGNSP